MSAALAILRGGAPEGCRPHERYLLTPPKWAELVALLARDADPALLGLWAEPGLVHAALLLEAGVIAIATTPAPAGRYAALSPVRPGAARFERMIHDLWGLAAEGGDLRPWLDHGRWPQHAPLSGRPAAPSGPPPRPEFLAPPDAGPGDGGPGDAGPGDAGPGIHQIPLGPIHGGITESAHARFHVRGERVVRLEQRLGYLHKGIIGLMQGRSPRAAARFAARLSGDSTVAHAWAFAMAAEAAAGATPPPRALALRAVMLELERIHNHLHDWGATCEEAGLAWMQARCGVLREGVLRACATGFGHRLMMDCVAPGGVAVDIAPEGAAAIRAALDAVGAALPVLARVHDSHGGLADRVVGIGVVPAALAARFAAGGVVGRAAGRDFDARRLPGNAPYDALDVPVPVLTAGDVDARLRLRIAELPHAIDLVRALLAELPLGELAAPLPPRAGEGIGIVEGFRGECLHWLALDDGGLIRAAFPRDPSWLQWPLLEAAMAGGDIADFPLCARSFNGSVSGVDL